MRVKKATITKQDLVRLFPDKHPESLPDELHSPAGVTYKNPTEELDAKGLIVEDFYPVFTLGENKEVFIVEPELIFITEENFKHFEAAEVPGKSKVSANIVVGVDLTQLGVGIAESNQGDLAASINMVTRSGDICIIVEDEEGLQMFEEAVKSLREIFDAKVKTHVKA